MVNYILKDSKTPYTLNYILLAKISLKENILIKVIHIRSQLMTMVGLVSLDILIPFALPIRWYSDNP